METIYLAVVMVHCIFASITPLLTSFITPSLSIIPTFGWKKGFGGPPDRGQGIYTYHPDFSNRHPAYFDVLVRNKLQLGNPNSASTDALASAITGEFEKDSKHAGSVEEVGGHFYPLVTKMLEVWTSSSFLQLCTFVERITLRNGLSPFITAHNLMQLISVKLWSYNAKMILQHFGRPPTMDHPLNVCDII